MNKIGEYEIHPVAEMFPLMQTGTKEWRELVGSIEQVGQIEPIVCDGKTLIDGRNRLRACIQLGIEPRVIEWASMKSEASPSEWIAAKNLERRNLTPDQKAIIAKEVLAWEFSQVANKQKESQFKKGESPNPGGKPKAEVSLKSGEPERDFKKDHENSSAGKLAKKAGVSRYKAEQALALDKAIKSGKATEELREKVKAGEVKLKDAMESVSDKPARAQTELRDRVLRSFKKLLGAFNETDRKQVLEIISEIISTY